MVLNAAVQMLSEADELKQKILKFKNGTSMLQERTLWITQQQLQKLYQKVLVLDLDYALDKKVEQDLWNVGFKQQIEALQAISKDKKNQLRSEAQAMLSWVLQAAAGFYLCLLHQICTTLKLDLPFRRRASLLGCVEGWGAGEAEAGARMPPPAAARYICQHCLVHLGDLARYRQQLRVAHTFYRHALVVSAHSGQPYNQLALVAWRRGRRLAALYWHVRSLLVRAPFPPAPANLARTLAAAAAAVAASRDGRALPVLGESPPASPPPRSASPRILNSSRLDSHSYINEFIRVVHIIYTSEQLDTATDLVDNLNSSLTALIATNSFDSMTLIKMSCVIMWLVHATTEGHAIDRAAMTAAEATAALLADTLAAGALLALLLPAYTVDEPLQEALPAVCVWAQWAWCARDASGHVRRALDGAAWAARPQLWPALAHTLNALTSTPPADAAHPPHHDQYWNVPLPEDEELVGFTPLEGAHSSLRFSNHAAWDSYGGRTPDYSDADTHVDVTTGSLNSSPELERRVRAHRLVELGKRLAEQYPEHITYSEEDEGVTGEGGGEEGSRTRFVACSGGGEQLSRALDALLTARDKEPQPPRPPPPPLIISEADFREKVREKRVGILKPQGSLERAREERALANTADNEEQEESGETEPAGEAGSGVEEEKREARRTRVNIAMAAIMRKQEEGNKQVKFVTPPVTPELATESEAQTSDKPKVIQPKVIKSLANLPVGRKTGGILSLKDKSAGYPHLVNADPEQKTVEEKKEIKQSAPQIQQRRQDLHQPQQNWPAPYGEGVRMNYSMQNPGVSYNPNFNSAVNNHGIRLPVVNPKEIDVRTAAIQKQNSRPDLFQDGNKMGNQGYQMSGDKKNFLNDLPPRFANQFRHWQHAQENQHGENKFRDDNFKANFSQPPPQPRPNWMNSAQQETVTPTPWWKPDNHNFLNYSAPPMNIPNFYSHLNPNVNVPYPNQMPQFNMSGQNMQQKPDINYMQSTIGQQMPTLQNLVAPPNLNPTMNLGTFPPTVGYDSNMYPQFNKFQPPMKPEKPQGFEGGKEFPIGGLGYNPNVLEMQQRNMSFGETFNNDTSVNNMDHMRSMEGVGTNTYSLFSGGPEPSAAAWGSSQHSHQSLWSGPGPSPLERLLEQQKQMRQPPAPH